ncbi:MAG: hypothetical protein FWE42_02105 [Defluviitaleaceae bacterium]|nr:hypothetical protein [Defluviitaleaceae bacterium]
MKIIRMFRRGLPWSLLWLLLGLIILPIALGVGLLLLFIFFVLSMGGIRYYIDARFGEDKTAHIEFSYFMRLIHVAAKYIDGKLETRVRIAWIKLGEKKPKKKKPKTVGKTPKPKAPPQNQAINSTIEINAKAGNVAIKKETPKPPPKSQQDSKIPPPLKKEKKDRFAAFKQVKAVLTYPERKIIMALVLQCIQKFLKALKPKKLDIHGIVGFDDPATTGWVMGSYEAITSVLNIRHKIKILGSYHEKALDLSVSAKGRTRLWRLMWPFAWLYLKKPIRTVIHRFIFRKGDSNE